ncbi:AAA family ATPase [Actinomadura sp. 9N215]|uniref:AAA family ATPase n=1 Tax=Actinomadura sp. 9N215 TaxID=3375150 RepID=UPI003788EFC5
MLVGRAREVAEIDHLLGHAGAGSGGVLVIRGGRGAGKTAVAEAGMREAHRRGFEVVRASPVRGWPGRLVWSQLLRDAGAPEDMAAALVDDPGPLELDGAARWLASGRDRLIVVDDIDHGGRDAVEMLSVLAGRVVAGSTAVLATSGTPLDVGHELSLRGLSEEELAAVVGPVSADAAHALWVASRGRPGVARSLRGELYGLGEDDDPLVFLALHATSEAEFLDVDDALTRLLEVAVPRAKDDGARARVLARLAWELLGDASAGARRRELVDEAQALARRTGDPRTLAEVLDARLHALWDPTAVHDRLTTAAEIVDLARAAGDDGRERNGLFWRFVALMELGRVSEAESVLAAYERAARAAGDGAAMAMALSRHGTLAILRGRFAEAEQIAGEVAEMAERVRLPDARRLVMALRGPLAMERDRSQWPDAVEYLRSEARRLPGHFIEALAAWIMASLGRDAEASAELERLLPRALAGSGPRWVGTMANLAVVAVKTRHRAAAARLYEALLPYEGRLVVWGGAISVNGSVGHHLGSLAAQLGRLDTAIGHLEEALALEERIGALPSVAHTLVRLADTLTARSAAGDADEAAGHLSRARSIAERLGMTTLLERLQRSPEEWLLRKDGQDWLLEAGAERARLRDSRGLHYLRALLAAPGRDIPALDLVAGGAGLVAPSAEPLLDETALAAYRRRLARLEAELDTADETGDVERAAAADSERQALVHQLRQASGLGDRPRRASSEAERARVNVTRTLRSAIERLVPVAPRAAAHLRASIKTGLACRYDPAPGGPPRWHV